jgi:hypothetical protein
LRFDHHYRARRFFDFRARVQLSSVSLGSLACELVLRPL